MRKDRSMPIHDWMDILKDKGALWIYDGEPCPEKPHAKLASGKHSNGFFNAWKALRHGKVGQKVCDDLYLLFRQAGGSIGDVDVLWGSAMGAVPMLQELSRKIGIPYGFSEKDERNGEKVMTNKRFDPPTNQKMLMVEDVITTGSTTRLTKLGIAEANFLPVILAIVNRSGMTHLDGQKILALVDYFMPKWTPEECPYCAVGSQAIDAKRHWARITGQEGE